jgi:CTP:molybdopterin cytidylyltransferase MocA
MILPALIPAGGRSSRMGRPKLSLPLGDSTVLGCLIAALRQADVSPILVVAGPHDPRVPDLARAAGASVCALPGPTADMRATVEHGLAWLEQHCRPAPAGWLLVPADHPAVAPELIGQMRQAWIDHPGYSIVVPTHTGRRGHPTLIAWAHVLGIRAHPQGLGLNTYLRQHAGRTLELPVSDPRILWDLDTPEDYDRLCVASTGRIP